MAVTTGASTRGQIVIRGARTHNLKNVDLTIPPRSLVVMTGVSGSGKSSLAFDTIYAEGQRRYVESLSAYARQFLERMEKPDVDSIEGICPAIAIRQKNSIRNPRSTVGTTTEIHDYLRLLYARVGRTFCRSCGREVIRETAEVVARRLGALPPGHAAAHRLRDAGGHCRGPSGACRKSKRKSVDEQAAERRSDGAAATTARNWSIRWPKRSLALRRKGFGRLFVDGRGRHARRRRPGGAARSHDACR